MVITSVGDYPVNAAEIKEVVSAVAKEAGLDPKLEVSISIIDIPTMQELNREFHNINSPTDVLSFPFHDPQSQTQTADFPEQHQSVFGEIVVAFDIAAKQAQEKQTSVDEEILFLIEHGMQHLLGNHHD